MYRYPVLFLAVIFGIMAGSVDAANTLSTGGHDGIVRCQSADPLGAGTFELGGAIEYGQEWDYILSVNPNDRYGSPRMLSGVGNLGYGLFPILDIGLNLPAYYDNPQFGSTKPKGIGDLEFSLKLSGLSLSGESKVVTTGCYLSLQFPTGDSTKGFIPRHVYYASRNFWSSGNVLIHPMLMTSIHFDRMKSSVPIQLHLNVGGVFNAPADHNAITVSAGLEYFPTDIWTFFTEVSAEERIGSVHGDNFIPSLNNNPVFITPGVKFKIPSTTLYLTLAGDIGISDKDVPITSIAKTGRTIRHQANMLYNALFAVNWLIPGTPSDRDKDGIPDKVDKCPDKAGIAANQGCPDVDSDGDGIVDRLDKCPDKAGIAEYQGCPDYDKDRDGVPDSVDKCPDKAGLASNHGCPDYDKDKDGVADSVDKCPDKAGPAENQGCPDTDRDNDGVVDRLDKCPDQPGPAETQGCPPKTKEITRGQLILKGVNFESGKSVLKGNSYMVLDQIAESLREWSEIKIEIQGHTDNLGKAAKNQTLSQARAETVRQYLIEKGIAADRLTAVGYGPDRPIATNKTAAGRAQNRRVELTRIN
jgi:outer membrane protein OmpA-like peptidoglycan-associated protein